MALGAVNWICWIREPLLALKVFDTIAHTKFTEWLQTNHQNFIIIIFLKYLEPLWLSRKYQPKLLLLSFYFLFARAIRLLIRSSRILLISTTGVYRYETFVYFWHLDLWPKKKLIIIPNASGMCITDYLVRHQCVLVLFVFCANYLYFMCVAINCVSLSCYPLSRQNFHLYILCAFFVYSESVQVCECVSALVCMCECPSLCVPTWTDVRLYFHTPHILFEPAQIISI